MRQVQWLSLSPENGLSCIVLEKHNTHVISDTNVNYIYIYYINRTHSTVLKKQDKNTCTKKVK